LDDDGQKCRVVIVIKRSSFHHSSSNQLFINLSTCRKLPLSISHSTSPNQSQSNHPTNTVNMLRTFTRNAVSKTFKPSMATPLRTRGYANKRVEDVTQAAGEAKDTNPKDPSVISSAGAVGKQFNPDGNIGQVGEAVSNPPFPHMTYAIETNTQRNRSVDLSPRTAPLVPSSTQPRMVLPVRSRRPSTAPADPLPRRSKKLLSSPRQLYNYIYLSRR